MKLKLLWVGLVFGLSSFSFADSINISSFTPTGILPSTFFTKTTIALQNNTTNQIYLMSFQGATTTQFVTQGYDLFSSTGNLVLPDFHGDLYGESPNSGGNINLTILTGS